MIARDDQNELVDGEQKRLQHPVLERVGNNAYLRSTVKDRLDGLGTLPLLQIDVHAGVMPKKSAKRTGQEFRDGRGIRPYPNTRSASLRVLPQFTLHPFDLAEYQTRAVRQCVPCRCGFDATTASLQQRQPERLLHAAQTGTGGRQGHVGLSRAVRDAAGFEDEQEKAQVYQIEAHNRRSFVDQP